MIELKENELYIFEGRVLRLQKRPFHNRKEGGEFLRVFLTLLKQDELNKLIVKERKNESC